MKKGRLTCEQVMALMSFYVENKLSDQLTKCVKIHLDNCPDCAENYMNFQKMLGKYYETARKNEVQEDELMPYQTKQYDEFRRYLSEYFDNELDDAQNIKIKKIAISNPLARRDLEAMYSFKKLLHQSFDKTKNEIKDDYSKSILSLMEHDKSFGQLDSFFKLAATFLLIVSAIIVGFYFIMI